MDIKIISFTFRITATVFYYLTVAEAEHDSGNSDFSEVRRSKLFIDKTSFIEDFIKDGSIVKIITAPSKSGKSTMVDMLKRFLSLPIDTNGKKISLDTTTANYRLFCQPKLKICENDDIVKDHMGQYPVIHINYHKLKQVHSFESLLQQLRYVIFDTFAQHKYLSQNSSLFEDGTEDLFKKHYDTIGVDSLADFDLLNAFRFLAELLHKHFNKKVIVLLDEYDAYCLKLLFGKVDEEKIVINFLKGISSSLFKYNDYIEKGMLTGVLRLEDAGAKPTGNMVYYPWLGDHVFYKYYAITSDEILKIIKKFTEKEKLISQIKLVISKYYKFEKHDGLVYTEMGPLFKFFRSV